MYAIISLPPTELDESIGYIPFREFIPFLPNSYHSAPKSTPVLNISDLVLTIISLGLIFIEYTADHQMYEFQTSKYASREPKIDGKYPITHHPGFITTGLFKYTRHPNFAAEQLFWACQALFVVGAGRSSAVTRQAWMGGGVFGPPFAVSEFDNN
jgi:steroid 5-alpha reductase family enzyme